jgi:DNA-binding transcriptional LysR family regulator
MEIRTLRYFLAVAQEGNITNAAKRLHVTQPTLSRQLADLEKSLGRQLYTRGHAGIELTEHGAMLLAYAESIVDLADKAELDIKLPSETVSGSVHIAAGETKAMELLTRAMMCVREEYPGIDFQIYSGTTADLMDGLVRGQYDFLLECDMQPHVNMNVLELPNPDVWGIIAPRSDPLAKLGHIKPEDIADRKLITSRQGTKVGPLHKWLGDLADQVDVVATYSLGMNAKWLIRAGFGVAFAYDEILTSKAIGDASDLAFIPLEPRIESRHGLVWRKALPTRQAQVFLDEVRKAVDASPCAPAARSATSAV